MCGDPDPTQDVRIQFTIEQSAIGRATAYDSMGIESILSNMVFKDIP